MKRKFLPYSRQSIDETDIEEVVKVLRSDFVTQGPQRLEFEKDLAAYCKSDHACVLATGSAALHSVCFALGLKEGDEVLVPNNTFTATAACVAHCRARPVLVDSDPGSFHMSLKDMEKKVTSRTRGVIPMHYAGMPLDMKTVREFAVKHRLWVVEDASHAIGAAYEDVRIGNCSYSDAAVFSFHPVKPLCAGEGGAVLTRDKELCRKIEQFANSGITKETKRFVHPELAAPWYAEQHFLGFNFRISEMQCALGRSQLKKIDFFIETRNRIAEYYYELLAGIPAIQLPLGNTEYRVRCAYHLFPVLIDFENTALGRAELMNALRDKGIGTQVHYIPLSLQPYYQQVFGYCKGQLVNSEAVYTQALSLPVSVLMTRNDVEYVCSNLRELLRV